MLGSTPCFEHINHTAPHNQPPPVSSTKPAVSFWRCQSARRVCSGTSSLGSWEAPSSQSGVVARRRDGPGHKTTLLKHSPTPTNHYKNIQKPTKTIKKTYKNHQKHTKTHMFLTHKPPLPSGRCRQGPFQLPCCEGQPQGFSHAESGARAAEHLLTKSNESRGVEAKLKRKKKTL